MKTLLALLLTAVTALAADPPKPAPPEEQPSFLHNISVSPFGTIVHDGIGDGESYGAGLALSYGINPFVSLELSATTYSDNDWRDEAIDESALLVKARLLKDESERFSLYAIAGADRDWGREDWALSGGLGVNLKVHQNVSLFVDSRLRAWMADDNGKTKDIATRAGLSLSF